MTVSLPHAIVKLPILNRVLIYALYFVKIIILLGFIGSQNLPLHPVYIPFHSPFCKVRKASIQTALALLRYHPSWGMLTVTESSEDRGRMFLMV